MLYAKQFLASFFMVLGLGLIVIGIVGAGNTLMADWNPLGEGGTHGPGCVSAVVCDNNCGWDAQNLEFTGGCLDTTPPAADCHECRCRDIKIGPGVEPQCIKP